MLDIYSIRRRFRYMFLLSLLVLASSPPPAPIAVTAAQPTPPSASTAGTAPDIAPLGPGAASTASLPKGRSACPSAPGKRNGSGAACSDTAGAPDSSPGKVSLPNGKSQCQSVNGKSSSPGAACWTASSTSQSPAAAEHVSLPAGSTRCPSSGSKQSSAYATCDAQSSSTQAGGLSGMKDATVMRSLDPNWSLSLYTSDSYIGVNHSITLSAYSNQDVGPSPYWISIFNAYSGALLNYCGYGYSCSATYAASGVTTQAFRAYVANYPSSFPPSGVAAMSGFVYTTWISITNLTASPQYIAPNQATTITVSASVDVGPTPYWLEIFDGSTGRNVAICAYGRSCSASVTLNGAAVHYFTGYISGYGTSNPPPSVQSATNVYAFWMSVTISASAVALAPGGTTNLVATANADVLPSPYYISIFDTTTNTRVTNCASGSVCSANYTVNGSSVRDFFAYIGGNGTSAPPSPVLVSSNNYVEVTWMTVGLTVSPPLLSPTAPVTLNAFASMSMAGTNYYIALYDQSTGYITECGNASSCTTSVTQPTPTTHTFIAYIDGGNTTNPPGNIRAQSSPGAASWVTVALRACNYKQTAGCPSNSWTNGTVIGAPITFTASTQVNVQGTGYAIQILDPAGNIGASCTSGNTCTFAGATQTTAGNNYTYGVQIAVPNSYPTALAAVATGPTLKWVAAHKPWAADGSASGFAASSQWDYSDDPSGSAGEYGIDEGLPTLASGSVVYAPESGNVSYQPSTVWWEPGRLVLLLDTGGMVGFGHVNMTVSPGHVDAGKPIAVVACNPGGGDCSNSHVEFMYDPTVPSDDRNIWSFRPPASSSVPVSPFNGCPRHTYTTSGGNSVDPCAWLSAYLLYGS
jgi:hypothetical protein